MSHKTIRTAAKGRVLIADDEATLREGLAMALTQEGYAVDTAADGKAASEMVKGGDFDVIVSDISMPEMNGIQLLRAVRERDLDVPVILMTGDPAFDTAVTALEYGAMRYLVKPINLKTFVATVEQAARLHRLAKLKREALAELGESGALAGDRAGLEASFSRALEGFWMAFQPIVRWSAKEVYGYEALVRPTEPTLPHPGALFHAAERLGRLNDLGRAIRRAVAAEVAKAPPDLTAFINLHTRDLLDEALYLKEAPLSKLAKRVILEITERASLDEVRDVRSRVAELRRMGYRIAIDDLGAGYAGLTSFAQLEPEVVKLDISLVRDVHKEPTKQKLVRSMVGLCREMGLHTIVEGIEAVEERDALVDLGCDLMQGYLFAKPDRPFPAPRW